MQAAVQQSGPLDSIAKRDLVQALDHVLDQRYVDAEPPLYQGLERAFRYDARRRGVIDDDNKFLIAGERRSRATSVEHLFEHLIDDRRYLRFLRGWVFGPLGSAARHGDLPEAEHRRWVLRAFVAVVGWLEYCGADDGPMRALTMGLELGRGDAGAAEDTA